MSPELQWIAEKIGVPALCGGAGIFLGWLQKARKLGDRCTALEARVQSLELILNGVTNIDLKEAIEGVTDLHKSSHDWAEEAELGQFKSREEERWRQMAQQIGEIQGMLKYLLKDNR